MPSTAVPPEPTEVKYRSALWAKLWTAAASIRVYCLSGRAGFEPVFPQSGPEKFANSELCRAEVQCQPVPALAR